MRAGCTWNWQLKDGDQLFFSIVIRLSLQIWCFFLISGMMLTWPTMGQALTAGELLVIANGDAPGSVNLARYYMQQRQIPENHLLVLHLPETELCSRKAYDLQVAQPVRIFLKRTDPRRKIKGLVTVFGLPLKIQPPAMTDNEHRTLEELKHKTEILKSQLAALKDAPADKRRRIESEISSIQKRLAALSKEDRRSSLDSELALVRVEHYSLSGWIPNPYFPGFNNKRLPIAKSRILLVSRLDGPSPEIARRIIDDSIQTENKGLSGIAYFDARWPKPDAAARYGYHFYDRSIHLAADLVRKSDRMKVELDEQEGLLGPGQRPQAALYCGWYSPAKYVDAFDWSRGAVGYHIASYECGTLKDPASQVWCKRMLEDGVAATIGPTSEPYVQAFPVPEIFFGLLLDGRMTLAECYARALPYLSWQMVLIGDPLYRPFARREVD